jgi:hypothetical protein
MTDSNLDQANKSPLMVSGVGQFHTNEPGNQHRKEYLAIDWDDVKALVDNPQTVDKTQAQWLIPSSLPSRNFKEQEAKGAYGLLWADLDKNPPPLNELASIVKDITQGCDYELYNSRSATEDNQKARLLIPLDEPLCYADWRFAQEALNDALEAKGIIPDRANERAAQLCYLPNRGALYKSVSNRSRGTFEPVQAWAEKITAKREKAEDDRLDLELEKEAAKARREALKLSDAPDLIDAFNLAFTPHDWLTTYGYDQHGDSFRHPGSESGSYSCSVKEIGGVLRANALSPNDPLYTDGNGAHDAFSVFTVLMHGGDRNAAMIDAGDNLLAIEGVSWNKAKQREYMAKKELDSLDDLPDLIGEVSNSVVKKSFFTKVSIVDIFTNPPEPQRYIWGDRIPCEASTLLAAHGGTGKSSFALQLAVSASVGAPYLGLPVEQAKTLFFSAEDSKDVIRRRLANICADEMHDPAEVDKNLIVLDATETPCLFEESNINGVKVSGTTSGYDKLVEVIKQEKIEFLIIDNASDTFGANPVDRGAVTKYTRALVRAVKEQGGTVLLLAHVNKVTSKAGTNQTDTEGYADSAAWHNAARSRLFLVADDNNGVLTLKHQKNNYGVKQPPMQFLFRDKGSSLAVLDAEHKAVIDAEASKKIDEYKKPILGLIKEKCNEGILITPSDYQTANNTFKFAKETLFKGEKAGRDLCNKTVSECISEGFLTTVGDKSKHRKDVEKLQITDKGEWFLNSPDASNGEYYELWDII